MDDLISRKELRKAFKESGYFTGPQLHWVRLVIDQAPTVLHDNYSMGYQDGVKTVMSERLNGGWHLDVKASDTIKFNKIKALIDNWAVDDDEHALLERIAYIVDDMEAEDDKDNN